MDDGHRERNRQRWVTSQILLTAATFVLLTVSIAYATWRQANVPSSEFPAWLEAWGTVLGVGAAIVAGFYAARAFRLKFERERRWEDQQRSAQASLVAAWPSEDFRLVIDGQEVIHAVEAYARNASALPVSQIEIHFFVTYFDQEGEKRSNAFLGSVKKSYLAPNDEPTKLGYYSMDMFPHGNQRDCCTN